MVKKLQPPPAAWAGLYDPAPPRQGRNPSVALLELDTCGMTQPVTPRRLGRAYRPFRPAISRVQPSSRALRVSSSL